MSHKKDHHDELARLDATAQAQLIRRKEVTPVEVVEAAIRRIERLNPKLNAVVTPLFESAIEEAQALTKNGPPPAGSPFAGVPFLVKDLTDVKGATTTWGSRWPERLARLRGLDEDGMGRGGGNDGAGGGGGGGGGGREGEGGGGTVSLSRMGSPALEDAEIVRRFRRAGFIVVGKSNTPEFGLLPTTEPKLFGPTRNPWDVSRSAGGSSGGAAAAVAAGLVPIAHANDGGGSIRIPASCCGLFGLKPSRGRTPTDPLGLVSEHVVTRSVRDSAAVLDWITGGKPGSPYTLLPSPTSFLDEIERPPGKLRIGVSFRTPTGEAVHPECEAAVQDAARLCEEMGHQVVEVPRVFDGHSANDAFKVIWAASLAAQIDSLLSFWAGTSEWSEVHLPEADWLEPATLLLYKRGKIFSSSDLLIAMARFERIRAEVESFFDRFDLWLTPTLAAPPPPLGSFELEGDDLTNLDDLTRRNNAFSPFTAIANVLGAPAASIPLYWSKESLPIGVQFMGPIGSEAVLFRLAAELERARPWIGRYDL